jgi:hypothetical protein
MTAYFPARTPSARLDRETPRVAVRAGATGGFLFLNNYQKDHPLPEQKDFQVQVRLSTGAVKVPRHPAGIPNGAYTFWPVDQPLGGAVLEYATAQPLCKLQDPDTVVFFAWPGIAPEFAFQASDDLEIEAPQARLTRENGRVYVSELTPTLETAIRIRTRSGHSTGIVLVSRDQARNIWKTPLAGRERLVYSGADLYFEADRIHLGSTDDAALAFGVFPNLDRSLSGFSHVGKDGIFERYAASVKRVAMEPVVRQLAEAGRAAPVRMGKEVAMAPEEAAFDAAARWSIRVPEAQSSAVGEIFLRIVYQGDVARLNAGDRLIADDFYHGAPWEIGLRNIPAAGLQQGLELKILPLRADAPIYLGAGVRPAIPEGGQVAKLTGVQLVPEYRAVADLRP